MSYQVLWIVCCYNNASEVKRFLASNANSMIKFVVFDNSTDSKSLNDMSKYCKSESICYHSSPSGNIGYLPALIESLHNSPFREFKRIVFSNTDLSFFDLNSFLREICYYSDDILVPRIFNVSPNSFLKQVSPVSFMESRSSPYLLFLAKLYRGIEYSSFLSFVLIRFLKSWCQALRRFLNLHANANSASFLSSAIYSTSASISPDISINTAILKQNVFPHGSVIIINSVVIDILLNVPLQNIPFLWHEESLFARLINLHSLHTRLISALIFHYPGSTTSTINSLRRRFVMLKNSYSAIK